MISDYIDPSTAEAIASVPGRQIAWAFTPGTQGNTVTAGAITAVFAPDPDTSGTLRVKGMMVCVPRNGTPWREAATETIEVGSDDEVGWYTLRLPEPITGLRSDYWFMALRFDGASVAAWGGNPDDTEGFYSTVAFDDPTINHSPEGDSPRPLAFADILPEPAVPSSPDEHYARLGFNSAQATLGGPGPQRPRYRGIVGWHGTYIDPESQGASFAIVQAGGPLAELLGERVKVTYGNRWVFVYVHRVLDLGSGEDISLSRRAFQNLAPLATDSLTCRIEALGPSG